MIEEAKRYYQVLIDNDELSEVFPKATGDWSIDEKKFCKFYEENIKFVLDFENGTLNEEEEYFIDEEDNGDTSLF